MAVIRDNNSCRVNLNDPDASNHDLLTVTVSVPTVDVESWRKRSLVSIEPQEWGNLIASCIHMSIRVGVGVWSRITPEGYC